ncbi:MAG TPA: hypothetical protein VFR47_00370, partial [Anaerolineales bacterium]|nr:hypothetical protein [Anaerolineales bacterium]
DWLAALRSEQDKQTPASSKPAADEGQPSDFFSQFESSKPEDFDISPTIPLPGQGDTSQEESLPWLSGTAGQPQNDELSDWFSQTSEPSRGSVALEGDEMPPGEMGDLTARSSQDFDSAQGKPAAPEASEDLSWLHDLEASTKGPQPSEPTTSPADMDWISKLDSSGAQEDLSWLKDLGGTPGEPVADTRQGAPTPQPESGSEDLSWLSNLGGTLLPGEPPASGPTPPKEDDLGWLNTLGETTPSSGPASSSGPAKEDLSWLDNLGGTPIEPASSSSGPAPAAADDLSWLKDFGGTPAAPAPSPAAPTPGQEDLDWLKDLPGIPAGEPPTSGPAPAADDLSWLNNFGGTPGEPVADTSQGAPTPGEPSAPQEDLSWLDNLGGAPAVPSHEPSPIAGAEVPDWLKDMEVRQSLGPAQPPQYTPARTAPLSADAVPEIPDWLKSATEETSKPASLPPLSAVPADRSVRRRISEQAPGQPAGLPTPEGTQGEPVADTPQGAPADQGVFSTPGEPTLANQDVDALFAVDMPDWLSQPESAAGEASAAQAEATPTGVGDDLAPVELPSWVQAMRPVEAMIAEAADISADQTMEREGPLAGLRGVIPFAPIGSAQRPKAILLKLQATDEQQAGASLVEQIIAGEATAQPLKVSTFISSQQALRWGLAILFLVVLSVIIGFGTQTIPISSALPVPEVSNISNVVLSLPSGVPVLVVMDYEPSLAGEMEAASGPLLDHLVVSRKPIFTFVATSPNGTGLVDRLLTNTRISRPAAEGAEGGLGYQAGTDYFNAGYIPAGLAGVRGFTEAPQTVLPSVSVSRFSEFVAVILITDQAEAGQMWIEQLTLAKRSDPLLAGQQLLVVASGQAGPMLRPYTSSQQVAGMISGMADAARYEYVNNSRPGIVRSYWDAFGAGLFLAIVSIVLGSLWSLFARGRARRAEAEPG